MNHHIYTTAQAHAIRIGILVGRVAVRKNWHPDNVCINCLLRHRLERRAYDRFVSRARCRAAAEAFLSSLHGGPHYGGLVLDSAARYVGRVA